MHNKPENGASTSIVAVSATPKREYIWVPQKCYAFITPDTPKEYGGLFARGLLTCSGVTITAAASGYVFLCHADAGTDFFDHNDGILTWLSRIPPNLWEQVRIEYQDKSGEDYHYGNSIKNALGSSGVQLVPFPASMTEAEELLVDREGKFSRDFDLSLATGMGTASASPILGTGYNYNVDTRSNALCGGKHPPICIFDGSVF